MGWRPSALAATKDALRKGVPGSIEPSSPRKTLEEVFLLLPLCALLGGCLGPKEGTSEKNRSSDRTLDKATK